MNKAQLKWLKRNDGLSHLFKPSSRSIKDQSPKTSTEIVNGVYQVLRPITSDISGGEMEPEPVFPLWSGHRDEGLWGRSVGGVSFNGLPLTISSNYTPFNDV